MSFRFWASSFFAAALVLAPVSHAQDNKNQALPTYRAGGLSFVIPAPIPDLVETGSDYRVLLEPYAPNSNRLIAAFMTPDDLTALQAGKVPMSKEYALVEIPRTAEFLKIDSALFEQLRQSLSQQYGGGVESNVKSGEEELNQRLKSLTGREQDIKIDKPIQLGRLSAKPNVDVYGLIFPVSGNGVSLQRAMCLGVIKVNNRAIFAYLYMDYKNEDTVKQLRATMDQWMDAILKANP